LIAILVSLAVALPPLTAHAANALAGNPSPYLAMHGEDPVHWRPWGPGVLAEARRKNRPLFVSSGYFACHWCHVMQRESYQNPPIAARLNRDFIPVKLDRELHPALDAYLIGFVERTAGQAGWPLNVFLTPEGYPFLGLTYAPTDQFETLLRRVSKVWSEQSGALGDLARRAARERAGERGPPVSGENAPIAPAELAERLKRQALSNADDLSGGFGPQTRFPMAPNLSALLELQARVPDDALEDFLRLTLDAMSRKGLRDHVGGGFYRYTVDPAWQAPHFEKMLYTQALLVSLYLRAADVLDAPPYREVARDTLEFLLEVMPGRDGAYVASLSAVDAAGVEGGYYLWRPEELRSLLEPDERRVLALVWGVEGPPDLQGGYLPMGVRSPEQAGADLGLKPGDGARLMASARSKLLAARARRGLPRDDKQLAGWNGLVLSALAAAERIVGAEAYAAAGNALSGYLRRRLWDGERLHRAVSDQGWVGEATLEDYAFVARGLRDWGLVSGSEEDLALSRRLVVLAWDHFYRDGRWRLSADPLLPEIPAETAFADSPLPSPSAVLIALSLEASDGVLAAKARQGLARGLPTIARSPFVFASQALLSIEYPKDR
jgi:uncharacterized protein YyaL (SSP411 family)